MKNAIITIRVRPALQKAITREAKRTGLSRSVFVRNALERKMPIAEFNALRRQTMPLAEAAGYLTDDDVFRDVS